jgi:hypothetical protein
MEKNSTRAEFQLGLQFSSRFMSPAMRFSAVSNGMKYPTQSQINSDNRLNGFVLRFNCLIFNILYATTLTQVISIFCQSVPIRVLSIRSDPGFVNPFRSGFCQSVPIRSDPFRSVPIRVLLMPPGHVSFANSLFSTLNLFWPKLRQRSANAWLLLYKFGLSRIEKHLLPPARWLMFDHRT